MLAPTVKRKLKIKGFPIQEPVKAKMVLKLKPELAIPQPAYISMTVEVFMIMQEYYSILDEPIPRSDIQWYIDELKREKEVEDIFWDNCSVTRAFLNASIAGDDVDVAVALARIAEKKKPIKESDIGEMPAYGSPEFWAWCRKRKQFRLQQLQIKK